MSPDIPCLNLCRGWSPVRVWWVLALSFAGSWDKGRCDCVLVGSVRPVAPPCLASLSRAYPSDHNEFTLLCLPSYFPMRHCLCKDDAHPQVFRSPTPQNNRPLRPTRKLTHTRPLRTSPQTYRSSTNICLTTTQAHDPLHRPRHPAPQGTCLVRDPHPWCPTFWTIHNPSHLIWGEGCR